MNSQQKFNEARKSLGIWDGISKRGEAAYDAMFEAEKGMMDEYEAKRKYAGMTASQKQEAMNYEADEAAADNDVYDYYND